jgi:hypothetical protein
MLLRIGKEMGFLIQDLDGEYADLFLCLHTEPWMAKNLFGMSEMETRKFPG